MLQGIVEFCASPIGIFWVVLGSDVAIATAYFAIPITMAIVLRHRYDDIPYPWLWLLFVTFIVACGLTHTSHVWAAAMGYDGKWAIHPTQIAPLNEAFSPGEEEVQRAQRIVDAMSGAALQGKGAVQIDGKLVDIANIRMAQNVLSKAQAIRNSS